MNRINQKGLEVLEYRTELDKEYPQLVKQSLKRSLEQMVENHVLDMDTFQILKENSMSQSAFREYLLGKSDFLKTRDELLIEFDALREQLNLKLEDEDGIRLLETFSDVDNNQVKITRTFSINERFVLDYFKVDQDEVERLMRRKGFVEKFAVLRLGAIFKEFSEQTPKDEGSNLSWDVSMVYFEKNTNSYNIDLVMTVEIEQLEQGDMFEQLSNDLKALGRSAERFYNERMKA